jgi:hypothetical protein
MPEVTITYNNPKTLGVLKAMAKYCDFIISKPKANKKEPLSENTFTINGVTVTRGNSSIDTINNSEMNEIMARSNMDAKELRSRWKRNK